MPPSSKIGKKRVAETPAPTEFNKKQKQLATSKKAGPVLDLATNSKSMVKDYVDKYLLDLFAQVEVLDILVFADYQDEQGFRVATFVFWRGYFVYQRGQPEEGRNELLSLIKASLNNTKFRWKDHEEFINKVWLYEHDELLKEIEGKFNKHVDAWVKSDAGVVFEEKIAMSRYNIF
jgi:hypothetical protein